MEALKVCNCKASKCAKAYCDCFAAKQYCGVNCHCIDCQNCDPLDPINPHMPHQNPPRHISVKNDEAAKVHKGCACKKSNCKKKYCECYNAGLVCTQSCKCVECQNLQSFVNRKVIKQFKKIDTETNSQQLYRMTRVQNQDRSEDIKIGFEKESPSRKWMSECASRFYNILKKQDTYLNSNSSMGSLSPSIKTQQIVNQFSIMLKEIEDQKSKNMLKFMQE